MSAEVKVESAPDAVRGEPIAESSRAAVEPAVVTEPLPPAIKAKVLKTIETSGTGQGMDIRLATDGDVAYNAFKLEKPSRAVIDLNGVSDKLAKNIINVSDPVVKRIRVSQFKSAPEAGDSRRPRPR